MLLRWTKRITLGVTALLLLIVLTVWMVLFTQVGVRLVVWAAPKFVDDLVIADGSGQLLGDLTLEGVEYHHPDMPLAVDRLWLRLDRKCLLEPAICIQEIGIEGLNFDLAALPESEEQSAPEEPSDSTELLAPLPITVKRIVLDRIALSVLGHQVDWSHFESGLHWQDDTLTLTSTTWEDLNVVLAASDASNTKATEATEEPETETDFTATVTAEEAVTGEAAQGKTEAITLPEVVLPLNIDIERFSLVNTNLNGVGYPIVIQRFSLSALLEESQVTLRHLDLDMPEGKLELKGDATLNGDYPLDINANLFVKHAMLPNHRLQLQASRSIANLNFSASLDGILQANVKGELNPLEPILPFDVEVVSNHLQWPLSPSPEMTLKRTEVKVKGDLDRYDLALQTFLEGAVIPATGIDLTANGSLEAATVESLQLQTLEGDVNVTANARWSPNVDWQAELSFEQINPGVIVDSVSGKLNGILQTHGKLTDQGGYIIELPTLSIDGELMNIPFDLAGELSVMDTAGTGDIQLNTEGLRLQHGPNGFVAKGYLAESWDMGLDIDAPDLAQSLPDIKGEVKGVIQLAGEMLTPEMNIDLSIEQFAWQELATLSSLTLNGDVSTKLPMSVDLALRAEEVKYEESVDLDVVRLTFQGSEASHQLRLAMKGLPTGLVLEVDGGLTQDNAWKGAISRSRIETPVGVWALDQPANIDVDLASTTVNLGEHCWVQSPSKVCLTQPALVGESGKVALSVTEFNFDKIARYMPSNIEIDGDAYVDVVAAWSADVAPQVDAKLRLPPGKVSISDVPFTQAWNKVVVNAIVNNDTLSADWLLDLTDNGQLQGDAEIVGLTQKSIDLQQIKANVGISDITLDFLTPFVADYSSIAGKLNSQLALTGDVLNPGLQGDIRLESIKAAGKEVPFEVENADITTRFDGHTATLEGRLQTPDGELNLEGDADWQQLTAWKTNLNVSGERLDVSVPSLVSLEVSPNLTISATPEEAIIEGNIDIPWARIKVDSVPETAVGVSSDEIILTDDLEPIVQDIASPIAIKTNVFVNIGDDVTLDAFGLTGSLGGGLNVQQNNTGPQVSGEVRITDGSYRSFGQELQIDEGKILFSGPPDLPFLQVEAIRNPDSTQDDVIAGVRVTGSAEAPELEVFSDPVMPQQNALSYLLRGQDLDSEAGGNMMTSAMIGLVLSQSGQVVGDIGEAFGVQDLSVDTAGSGDDSQVTVSGYIAPGLQVKYGVGIFNSLAEFTVRYRLMRDLYVEGVSGLDSAVDVLYQFEFD